MPARRGAEEARARFSELLDAAERGDTTIILRRGKPVAAVAPIAECFPKQRSLLPLYGSGRGLCAKTIRELREEGERGWTACRRARCC